MDSNLGYITTNVVPSCKVCNLGKNNLPYAEFIAWIDQIVKFRKLIGGSVEGDVAGTPSDSLVRSQDPAPISLTSADPVL